MSTEKRMSLVAFQEHFGTEQQCRDYLVEKRWPIGFVCPKCGATAHCKLSNGMIQCGTCRHQTSVTAGTIMHRTHVPLTKWFLALYFTSQDKRGISAVQLKSTVSVKSPRVYTNHLKYAKISPNRPRVAENLRHKVEVSHGGRIGSFESRRSD